MGPDWEIFHSQLQRLFFMALAMDSDVWHSADRSFRQQGGYAIWYE